MTFNLFSNAEMCYAFRLQVHIRSSENDQMQIFRIFEGLPGSKIVLSTPIFCLEVDKVDTIRPEQGFRHFEVSNIMFSTHSSSSAEQSGS